MLIKPADTLSRLRRHFGADFPGLPSDGATGDEWRNWLKKKQEQSAGPRQIRNLHYTRHDNFRWGRQWLTQRDSRTWREPQADKNSLRPVLNLLGPALDFRLGILMEQRPGFAYQPITSGSAGKEVAEAQQAVVEYEFFRQRAWNIFLDAMFYAQTHGVSFVEVFIDKTRGPKHEDIEVVPQGDERYQVLVDLGYEQNEFGVIVPLDESGDFAEAGSKPRELHEGELYSRVILANEVIVDSEARTINGPHDQARWFIKRRARDLNNVRLELGDDKFQGDTVLDGDPNYESLDDMGARWQRGLPPFPSAKYKRHKEIVWEHSVYFPKSDALEAGAWIRMLGPEIVENSDELPGGLIPFARFSDGSPDPSLFPRPVMSDWVPDQIAINALLQSQMQAARLGGGRILSQKNSLIEESYNKIIGSMIEYTGAKPDFVDALRASPDIMPTLQFMIRQLENKDGWNDLARGQVTGAESGSSMQDVSGRALLGAKELFERTFGPMVRASAESVTEWAHIVVQLEKFTLSTSRMIPRVGRPDLAITINAEKLGDESMVYCDAETLMPLPKSLREQMLLEKLKMGVITLDQYQQRSPYADVKNLTMGDTPQWERAKWINTLIEERYEALVEVADPTEIYSPRGGMMVMWQDTPNIHKKALIELILNERKPFGVRKIASDRWGIYDQLERAQSDPQGVYPIPWEVIGVPPDKMQQQQQPPQPQQPMQGASQQQLQQPVAQPNALIPTSPVPEMSAAGPSAASQDAAQPLGSYGDVERAATDQRS